MIKEVTWNNEKKRICEDVLRDLPEWFGLEDSLLEYVENVTKYPFFALDVNDEIIGFYSLREENKHCLDMYVLGIKKKYHGLGYGTVLQDFVTEYAISKNYDYLMVLTLSEKHPDKGYKLTRDFYHKMGFIDVYQSDLIWGKDNPTQIMIKHLRR